MANRRSLLGLLLPTLSLTASHTVSLLVRLLGVKTRPLGVLEVLLKIRPLVRGVKNGDVALPLSSRLGSADLCGPVCEMRPSVIDKLLVLCL